MMTDKKLPDKNLPVTKISIRHHEGNGTRLRPCVHFITYGLHYGPTKIRFHTVLDLDLSEHKPPPEDLCERFTGLDDEIVESFFSIRANEEEFHSALSKLRQRIKLKPPEGCVAVKINCTAGMHRSVAMAERLASSVGRWDGFKAECLHLDLGKGMDAQAKKATRVSATEIPENMPLRLRRRSKHETQATSEAGVSEKRPRATADAVLPAIEEPLRRKTVWETTIPVEEPHFQQRETAGRSVDPREKVENRSRRLSS